MAETKAPVLFIELVDRKNSGFVLNGTENTANHTELSVPNILWIPNRGYRCVTTNEEVGGKTIEVRNNQEIRWVKNENEIVIEKQNQRGVIPNRYEDKIPVDKGYATVVREGATIGLYDYLKDVYFNESNPDRPETADAIFREVKLDERAEGFAEEDEMLADAIKMVTALRIKTGKDSYKYNENKINAYCQCLNVFGETPAIKIHALMAIAKGRPDIFINTIRKFDNQANIEIAHALELSVIKLDGNAVQSVEENKVYFTFDGETKKDQKIKRFADFLNTPEGAGILTELRAKVELAKEKNLK